jgi:hypothetical protein
MELGRPVRVIAFAMRAALTKSESAGENFNLVLAQQIIYGVGFFGILYSAYIMVLDRCVYFTTVSDFTTLTALQGNYQGNRGQITAVTDHRKPTPYPTRFDRCRFAQYYRRGPGEYQLNAEDRQPRETAEDSCDCDFLDGCCSPCCTHRIFDRCGVREDFR